MTPPIETTVLVVGAGPVGLALACFLRRLGVDCEVIDSGSTPTPIQESRALAVHARTLEIFELLGLAEAAVEQGRTIHALNVYEGTRRLARLELDFTRLGTRFPYILSLPQGATERICLHKLAEGGVTVHWRQRLEALEQELDSITATTLSPETGQATAYKARWLVGCDGAHSQVRHCLGLSFTGTAYPERFLLADARLDWPLNENEGHAFLVGDQILPALPLPEPGVWRLIDPGGSSGATDQDAIIGRFRTLLAQLGSPCKIEEVLWTSSFQIHRRLVDRLRVGRCFLAGDAAHIHSPIGGQGLNLGIQDAWNLAWKLALVASGHSSEKLLDSYQRERLPVAAATERGTDWATRIATLRSHSMRVVRDHLVSWLAGATVVRRKVARQISQLGVRYRNSPIVAEWGEFPRGSPRPGDRIPDLVLDRNALIPLAPVSNPLDTEPPRLLGWLGGIRHTLFVFSGETAWSSFHPWADSLQRLVQERFIDVIAPCYFVTPASTPPEGKYPLLNLWLDRQHSIHRHWGVDAPCLYLIRPDGHVAFRAAPPRAEHLAAYADTLFFQMRSSSG